MAALDSFDVVGRTHELDRYFEYINRLLGWPIDAKPPLTNPTPKSRKYVLSAAEMSLMDARTQVCVRIGART